MVLRRAVVVAALAAAACAADTPTYPAPPPSPPGVVLATQPTQLQAFTDPALIAGGATTVKVLAMGLASDGNLRGVPDVPVSWAATRGVFSKLGPLSDATDPSGLAAIVLTMPKSDAALDLGIDIAAGDLTTHLALLVPPSSVHGPGPTPTPPTTPAPAPTGGTGSTGSTGSTGTTGGTGGS
jgi:hypothetical protein